MSETVKSESDIEDPTSDASEKAAEDDLAPSASISKATTANDGTADLDENIIRRLNLIDSPTACLDGPTACLDGLPPEVFLNISKHGNKAELKSLRLSCSKFAAWLPFNSWSFDQLTCAGLRRLSDQVRTISELTVWCLYGVEADATVDYLLHTHPEVTVVQLGNMIGKTCSVQPTTCTDRSLIRLLNHTSIRVLHLTGSRATGKDLEQNGGLLGQSNMAPNLEDLSLADNRKLASTGLAVLLGSLDCTHLTSLDLSGTNLKLSGIQSLNSHQADKVGGARLLRLRRLGLGNTRLKDMEVNILINKTDGTVLEELDLGGTNVTLEEAHRLNANKFPNLAKLSLAKATRVTDIGLIGFINRLVGSALTELDLTGTRLALAEAGSLVNTLPRLRLLNLADCTQVTDRGLVALLNRLDGGRLEVLDLRCTCINLTEAAGGGLTNKLTGLKQLHLRGCEHVSDRGIFGLLNAIDGSRLALIDLCFTTVSLSEAGLLTNRLPGLTRLLLSCESLTDRGLQLLFTRLDGCCLQELDLSFTNVAFNFVATGDNVINNLPALMMLDLTGCKAVEEERLLTFLKQVGCVGLCELRVGQTDRVVAWEQITANFPSLKIVY